MKTLAEHLINVKRHLSDRERWEKNWESNRITGYSSGSLANDIGGIFGAGFKKEYPAAYECLARAISDLYLEELNKLPATTRLGYHTVVVDGWEFQPKKEHIKIVAAFGEIKNHEYLMNVLDLAIRYANLLAFT
jgi:hypothetical protein